MLVIAKTTKSASKTSVMIRRNAIHPVPKARSAKMGYAISATKRDAIQPVVIKIQKFVIARTTKSASKTFAMIKPNAIRPVPKARSAKQANAISVRIKAVSPSVIRKHVSQNMIAQTARNAMLMVIVSRKNNSNAVPHVRRVKLASMDNADPMIRRFFGNFADPVRRIAQVP